MFATRDIARARESTQASKMAQKRDSQETLEESITVSSKERQLHSVALRSTTHGIQMKKVDMSRKIQKKKSSAFDFGVCWELGNDTCPTRGMQPFFSGKSIGSSCRYSFWFS